MRLKISKKELIDEVMDRMYPSSCIPDLSQYPPSQWNGLIQQVINNEVRVNISVAIATLLENIYTEEEFESDIGLNR